MGDTCDDHIFKERKGHPHKSADERQGQNHDLSRMYFEERDKVQIIHVCTSCREQAFKTKHCKLNCWFAHHDSARCLTEIQAAKTNSERGLLRDQVPCLQPVRLTDLHRCRIDTEMRSRLHHLLDFPTASRKSTRSAPWLEETPCPGLVTTIRPSHGNEAFTPEQTVSIPYAVGLWLRYYCFFQYVTHSVDLLTPCQRRRRNNAQTVGLISCDG